MLGLKKLIASITSTSSLILACKILLKTSSHVKRDRGGLTKGLLEKLTQYYRGAFMSNTTASKDFADIEQAVTNMKKAIMANLCHNVYNKNPTV